jgi:hypothetical protein
VQRVEYNLDEGEYMPILGFRSSWPKRIATDQSQPPPISVQPISSGTAEGLRYDPGRQFIVMGRFFDSDGFSLRAVKPIAIMVREGEQLWFAENEQLDIFATGEDEVDAVKEFSRHVLAFYRHYESLDPSEALGEAKRLKMVFKEGFIEVGL